MFWSNSRTNLIIDLNRNKFIANIITINQSINNLINQLNNECKNTYTKYQLLLAIGLNDMEILFNINYKLICFKIFIS